MPTDKASYRKQDYGETKPFTDAPPKVWPDGSATDVDYDAVAPKQFTPETGSDSYKGIPGDGIVPG